jgi:hypothetical protein
MGNWALGMGHGAWGRRELVIVIYSFSDLLVLFLLKKHRDLYCIFILIKID